MPKYDDEFEDYDSTTSVLATVVVLGLLFLFTITMWKDRQVEMRKELNVIHSQTR